MSSAEIFESRQYPAATLTATLTAGVLNIEGTSKGDTITVQQNGDQLRVNGVQIKVGSSKVNQVVASQVQRITISGLDGSDTIRLDGVTVAAAIDGGKGNDNVTGGLGNDTITGGLGDNILDGGAGVNTLAESGNFNFALTNAQLKGNGNGTDTLSNITLARLTGGNGDNTLDASAFSGSVTLVGVAGKDKLIGGAFADLLQGGIGDDQLFGRGGADRLLGEVGNDQLNGEAGDDVLEGGAGNDQLNGGDDNDTFVFGGSANLGTDTFMLGDNAGANTLDFTTMSREITRLDLGQTDSQTVNANLKLIISSADAIDHVFATNFNDLIFGNGLANTLEGRDGKDTIGGAEGDDIIRGGANDDSLDGNGGTDRIEGNDGADQLFGNGADVLDGGAGLDTINGLPETAGTAMRAIIEAYNSGRLNVGNTIRSIVDSGFGQNLPIVQETIGEALDIITKLQGVFENAFDVSATQGQLEAAWRSLESAGFHFEYLGSAKDANGDLLRITYDRTFNADRVRFNVGGETGFEYFDRDVNGGLGGRFNVQSPAVRVHVTFGVDLVNNTPTFFVSDNSFVSFDDLSGSTTINGEMALRFLADVQAAGTLTLNLDGRLSLRDSDNDHKLRVSDFSNAASIVGDVDGSIVLNVDMNTNVAVLRNLTWHGDWRADVVDGRVNVGSPSLRMPSAAEVEQAIITSFVDMKNNFNFLGPVADALNIQLPVIGKTLAEAAGVGDKLGWLTESVDAARDTLRSVGVEFANIDVPTVAKLINGEKVDLIWFHQEDSTVLWEADESFLFAAVPVYGPILLELSGTIRAEVGWDWSVGFGVDTTGVWIDSGTHIGLYGSVRGGIEGELSVASLFGVTLEAGVGIQINAGLGLRDPDPTDGHIYMDELFRATEGRSLFQAIGDVMKFDIHMSAVGYARSELDLPWPLPDITLFDESFSIGDLSGNQREAVTTNSLRKFALAGQGEQALPAVQQGDTLIITGKTGTGTASDRDFVSLSGRDGNVTVKAPGYRTGSFTGVRKVVFNGGDGDDQLAVADDFNIAIEANGGAGDDLLSGGLLSDTLNGGSGSDQLNGQNGDDFLNGNSENDFINGGAGNDQLTGGDGNDFLQGGVDDDRLDGQAGDDGLEGGSGNDVLIGGLGNDGLNGGSGRDILEGNDGDDALNGDEGNDQLNGGIGDDILNGGSNDDTLNGGVGDDSLAGDAGNDSLLGENGQDTLLGGEDDDFADGGLGQDLIYGDNGRDELRGGEGEDTLRGGDGNDILRGGRDDDYLNGDGGADDINGDAGEDIIAIDLSTSAGTIEDTLAGGLNRDTLWIAPAFQNVTYNETTKRFSGSTGDNWIEVIQTSPDDFTATQRDMVTKQLIAVLDFTLSAGTDTTIETITIAGLDGNDFIDVHHVNANDKRDLILDGGEGNDTLIGGQGRDVIRGQGGNDSLVGNFGNDELHGGTGNDTLEGGAETDRLYGDDGDDSLDGGDGHDYQVGGAGNDHLVAGSGTSGDVMEGGANDDTLEGGNGVDFIQGGDGADSISGGAMGDFLDGNGANDTIIGGSGADIIFGGDGNDFVIAGTSEAETLRAASDWLAEELHVRDELVRLNAEILAKTHEVETLRAIPVGQRTDDENLLLAQLAQEELDLRNLEDQLSEVKRELNRERGAILVDELRNAGIELNYQAVFQDMVVGGDGNDTLKGSAFQDLLIGSAGDDEFRHSSGQDQIIGGEGTKDTYLLDGTNFDDTIAINGVQDGTSNLAFDVNLITNAVLMTSRISLDPDVEAIGVRGLGGNDTMTANFGRNALKDVRFEGGDGNDSIDVHSLESKATLIGGGGDDTLVGGLSDDFLAGGVLDVNGKPVESNSGNDSLSGGDGRDTLYGCDGSDTLRGGAENDLLLGGDGADWLYGNAGSDVIRGGEEADHLFGDDENFDLTGDSDQIYGDSGNDSVYAGLGNDYVEGGLGDDALAGMGGNDTIRGGDGADDIKGGNDDDWLFGDADSDQVDGQAGSDHVFGDDEVERANDGNDGLFGGDGRDFIYGRGGNDTIRGGEGNDDVTAGSGDDSVDGGDGGHIYTHDNDLIYGDSGNDTLRGNTGNDQINGGQGADWLFYNPLFDGIDRDSADILRPVSE